MILWKKNFLKYEHFCQDIALPMMRKHILFIQKKKLMHLLMKAGQATNCFHIAQISYTCKHSLVYSLQSESI